jgi:hypothetical protein
MKLAGVVLGGFGIAICLSGCTLPVVEHDLSSGGPSVGQAATLEYIGSPKIWIVEIDGRPVEMKRATGSGMAIRNLFKVAPGEHRILFRGDLGYRLHPEWIAFNAEAGKRYKVVQDYGDHKEADSKGTTLYFNYYSPVVYEERDGKSIPVATGASVPFKPQLDAEKDVLLYEDATIPKERTARVYTPHRGSLMQSQSVYFAEISGRAGKTQVKYQMNKLEPFVWQCRLLPGEYRLALTMTSVVSDVQSGVISLSLTAEAGHTYRVIPNATWGEITKGVLPGTAQVQGHWDPVIEDVTGKPLVDE